VIYWDNINQNAAIIVIYWDNINQNAVINSSLELVCVDNYEQLNVSLIASLVVPHNIINKLLNHLLRIIVSTLFNPYANRQQIILALFNLYVLAQL